MTKKDIVIYKTQDGKIKVDVKVSNETVWLTQAQLIDLFETSKANVSEHISNIFKDGELDENSVVRNFRTTASDGKNYDIKHYNLDMIISVGYRVKSLRATRFRIWATQVLKEYIIKGFAMDDERLKNPKGWDYFDELLERIREIRASEKRFYQKVRDLFSLSDDYSDDKEKTNKFFAYVQNKLLYAITKQTAAEIIKTRSDANKPNMNLLTWKGSRVRKTDVVVAKNYLAESEIKKLDRLVVSFLDYAEIQIEQNPQKATTDYWVAQVDRFVDFNNYPVLKGAGNISHKSAEKIACDKYEVFDAKRRKQEAIEADRLDREEMKELEQISRKKKNAK